MENRDKVYLKKLNFILLALILSLTGCKKDTIDDTKVITNIDASSEEVDLNDYFSNSSFDKAIYLNEYDDYKTYLKNSAPTYELLYMTVENNPSIPIKYKGVLNKIIELFEINEIKSECLGVFYENLYKLEINTDYAVNESNVVAFFVADVNSSSINIDENSVDFYSILHEVIHSCNEAKIRINDKIVIISSRISEKIIMDETCTIKHYGDFFREGQAEYIAQYMHNSRKQLFISSDSYNTSNNILEFWIDTLGIDINTFFSYSLNDFISSLEALGVSDIDIKNIINNLDNLLESENATYESSYQARYYFYQKYIPKLVEYYIKEGVSSKDIYKVIGQSLKNSVIEKIMYQKDIIYRWLYLDNQKKLFDEIDEWLKDNLDSHQMETSSIYYYIGHEFEIYYSLYGEEFGLNSGDYYLSHNWDETAINNCQILLYVEDNKIKMCSYAENKDRTLSCYDYNGEIKDINNGIKLCDLLSLNAINIEDGYLKFNYTHEAMMQLINNCQIACCFNKESITNAKDRYLYINNGNAKFYNLTTNENGEDIPYQIFSNQIYLISENAIKIGSINELIKSNVIIVNEQGDISFDFNELNNYIKESNLVRSLQLP